jgi:hypothetical protein
VASPVRRGSAIGNRQSRGARSSGMGGFRAGEGDLVEGRSGPIRHYPLEQLAGAGMPHRMAVLLCRSEQSRGGDRREREGEKGRDSN